MAMATSLIQVRPSNWEHVRLDEFKIQTAAAEPRSRLQKAKLEGRRCLLKTCRLLAQRDALWAYLDTLRSLDVLPSLSHTNPRHCDLS